VPAGREIVGHDNRLLPVPLILDQEDKDIYIFFAENELHLATGAAATAGAPSCG